MDGSKAKSTLASLLRRLDALRAKLVEVDEEERLQLRRLRARLAAAALPVTRGGVEKGSEDEDAARLLWLQSRVDRVIVDYLCRRGFYDVAAEVARDAGVVDLVELEVFARAGTVLREIEAGKCTLALAWCQENRSLLRKLKSTLEFELRLQEYVELVRERQLVAAVAYARKHLSPAAVESGSLDQIRAAMGLLAVPSGVFDDLVPAKRAYAQLLSSDRWTQLAAQFKADCYALYGLSREPLLDIALSTGLPALKTLACTDESDRNVECPVCSPDLGELAKPLPLACHAQSCLVCRISGVLMDENKNRPLILPNGNVYGRLALDEMAARNGDTVTDPKTGQSFAMSVVKELFIS